MSFFDHFTSLDTARWGTLTAGSGTAGVSDSNLELVGAGGSDAAAAYYKTRIDKTKSQLWVFNARVASLAVQPTVWLVSKATEPALDTTANWLAQTITRLSVGTFSSNWYVTVDKYASSDVRTEWNSSSNTWVTPPTGTPMMGIMSADDYSELALEIDGPSASWRWLAGAKSNGSSYSAEHGLQWWAITDWVTFASGRFSASTDLWLAVGHPYSDSALNNTVAVESVRFADGPLQHAWSNQKDTSTDVYNIKHWYCYDGQAFVPESRAGIAIAAGTGWESAETKDRSVVRDWDGTYYMAYAAKGTQWQIGMASSATGLDGSWSKYGSNPIVIRVAATHEAQVFAPYLIRDDLEPDSAKRWKCFYSGFSGTDSKWRLFMATASTPLATWTKQGTMVDVGSGGDFDEFGCSNPVVFRDVGQWEMWYAGNVNGGSTGWSVGRATATDANGPWTKDGAGARIPGLQDQAENITANLTDRTASMSSTSGFVADQLVGVNQNSDQNSWNMSRVRKLTTDTSLELYHRTPGFTTAASAQVRGFQAGSVTIHHVEARDGEWWFYLSMFQIFGSHGTFGMFAEIGVLATSTTLLGTKTIQWTHSPPFGFGVWNNKRSSENLSLARDPEPAYQVLSPNGYSDDGAWTGEGGETSLLWEHIDEGSPPNDTDYVRSEIAPSASTYEVAMSDPIGAPEAGTVRVRIRHGTI